jgi:hypothetical protein
MYQNISKLLTVINKHPILSITIIGSLWWYWPQSIPNVYSDGTIVKVERGLTYRTTSEMVLEIYPFMVQKRFLGAPKEAGVSSSIYYVTKKDLRNAKAQYKKTGGCWPSIFSSFKREFMVVGDNKKIEKFITYEGPPPLHNEPDFIKIKGHRLMLHTKSETASMASQIASMRNADFFSIESILKL